MRTPILRTFLLTLLITGGMHCSGQDVHFSQFRMSPIFLNPSTSGAFTGDLRAHLNYKNQWASLGNPYQTFAFSADGKLFQDKWDGSHLGLGGFAYRDMAGDAGYGSTKAKIAVSYNLALAEGQYIAAGLQGGFDQTSLNRDALKWGNQYDGTGHNPDLPSGETTLGTRSSSVDLGFGLDWRTFSEEASVTTTKGYWVEAGAAVHHVVRPERSLYEGGQAKLDMKYIGHVDASFGIPNTAIAILPGMMYARQGPAHEFLYGSMVRYQFKEESHFTGLKKGSALSIGVHNRLGDALIASMMLEYGKYAISLSYDVNVSELRTATNGRGGFEVSLRLLNPDPFTVGQPGGMPSF